jgi:hypothetical protein
MITRALGVAEYTSDIFEVDHRYDQSLVDCLYHVVG